MSVLLFHFYCTISVSTYKHKTNRSKYYIGDNVLTNTSPGDIEPTFKSTSGFTNMIAFNKDAADGMDIETETGNNLYADKPTMSSGF